MVGYLFVPKPTSPPFKWVCRMCCLAKISRQNNNFFYYNNCKVINECVLIGNLKGCICSPNKPIDVMVKFEWIKLVVNINEKALRKFTT
jgi:hypothetical protein